MTSGRPKLHRHYELLEEIRKDPRASIAELCERMGIKARSQMHGMLKKLEDEGLIHREPRKARSITLAGEPRRPQSGMKAQHTSSRRRKSERKSGSRRCDDNWRNKQQTPEQLEKAIERVVRKAKMSEQAGVDVLHDFRRSFTERVRATKVG